MKNSLLLIFLVGFFGLSFSQNYYEIRSLGHNYSAQTIGDAFNSADFCGYYFESERNKILFDDGAEVELKSNEELLNEGIQIENSCIIDHTPNHHLFTWSIASNGTLLKGSTSKTKSYPKGLIQY